MNNISVTVGRNTAANRKRVVIGVTLLLMLATVPFWADRANMRLLNEFYYYLALAQMWNLLAGYAGILSAGQQGYVGSGGYFLFALAVLVGVQPIVAIPLAGLLTALIAIPAAFIVFRLKGAYFAIGTWVVAEVLRLSFSLITPLGAGSGMSLPTNIIKNMATSTGQRELILYFVGLALVVLAVGLLYGTLRSSYGLALTAIRDNEMTAESVGIQTYRTKFLVYVAVAFVTGMIGAFIFVQKINITPQAAFSINDWLVFVIFIVVIGGIGTVEGPVVGTIIFFLFREWFEDWGTWYLMMLGVVAIITTLKAPRGIWGFLTTQYGWKLFPTQRYVHFDLLAKTAETVLETNIQTS